MIIKYNIKDSVAKILLIYCFSVPVFVQTINYYLISKNFHHTVYITYSFYALLIVLYGIRLFALKKIVIYGKQLAFWAFILGLFIYSFVFFPNNRLLIFRLITQQMWQPILTYIIFWGDYEIKQIKDVFKVSSYIYMFLSPVLFLVNTNSNFYQKGLYWTFGYMIVIPAVFFLYFYREEQNLKYLIFSIVCVCLLLLKGNRGAILCYLGYIGVDTLITKFSSQKLLLICLVFIIALNLKEIIELINVDLSLYRNLSYFIGGNFTSIISREATYKAVWDAIKQHWFIGLGIGGDRMVVSGGKELNTYAHNFILEILVSFGFFIGSGILLGLAYCTLSIFRSHSELKGILIVFFSLCFFKLMVSHSVWIDTNLYVLIALYGLEQRNKKRLLND